MTVSCSIGGGTNRYNIPFLFISDELMNSMKFVLFRYSMEVVQSIFN